MALETTAGPRISLQRETGFHFRVRFRDGRIPELLTDEPPPLGDGAGPSPTALLAAAIANCLAASLLYCLNRARLEPAALTAEAEVTLHRNEQGRLRVHGVRVTLAPSVDDEARAKMARCLEVFESFCTVTESVRQGFPVEVEVRPLRPVSSNDHLVDEYGWPVEEG
jgi:organic hydroperoxide reductase OsmC/OhrA